MTARRPRKRSSAASTTVPVENLTEAPPTLRNRIKELRNVTAAQLRSNPANWREHPERQRRRLQEVLTEIGIADALIARELPDGTLELIDGHLRADVAADAELPVLVLDVNEEEARQLLLSLDPLAALAETNKERLAALLSKTRFAGSAMQEHLAELQEQSRQPADKATTPDAGDVVTIEPKFSVLIECENEPDQRTVLEELERHGLRTRALTVGLPPVVDATPPPLPAVPGELVIERKVSIKRTARVKQLEGMFDVPPAKETSKSWRIRAQLDRPWQIGLIVGRSGAGKSTVARELFGNNLVEGWPWPDHAAIVDAFPSSMGIAEVTGLLSAVGFSSPPNWLKPFRVLSNGEQFRVNLARTLAELPELAVVDEFTSVVDRQVAQIGSAAVASAVRKTGRRFVAVTCHYDVEEWLQPDWTLDPERGEVQWRSLRRRPEIQLRVRRTDTRAWREFRGHHYLSQDVHPAAHCFIGEVDGRPAVFAAVLYYPHSNGGWWRGHRTVCLPDYQGVGIGNRISELIGGIFAATGKPYRSTTSHPSMIAHRLRSPLWACIRAPGLMNNPSSKPGGRAHTIRKTNAVSRVTAGFQYVGPIRREEAQALGVIR